MNQGDRSKRKTKRRHQAKNPSTTANSTSRPPTSNRLLNLTSLSLAECHKATTDEVVEAFANNCPSLTSVNLTGCYKITNAAIAILLEKCTKLTSLSLERCYKINCYNQIKKCTDLKSLNLKMTAIIDDNKKDLFETRTDLSTNYQ